MNILSCNNNAPNARYFSSIKNIPDEIYKDLQCQNNFYFNSKYLEALEKNNSHVEFFYIVLFNDHKKAIGFSTIQIIDFYLDSVQNEMQSIVERVKCIGRKLRVLSSEKPFKILTCGNTFVTGEHGFFIHPNQNKKEVLKQFVSALLHFVNHDTLLKNDIDAFMIKDFIRESLVITDVFHDEGYYSFKVEPNMVLEIDKDWIVFEDYLASMRTKFRVKAKKALKQSANIQVKEITQYDIENLLPEMTRLYKKVSSSASFNLGDFNLETYKALKENLKENYILKGYWLENKLVGFLSGIFNQNSLDAHFVGVDYNLNKQYAIYQKMLYDYVSMAITKKLTILNFGRTASEIKSSVGAVPQEMTIYLRHKNTIPNKILSLFLNKIKPTEFKQKYPFKDKTLIEK